MKGNLARSLTLPHDSAVLGKIIVDACGEAKGKDLVWLDLRGHSDVTDSFIVVSGRSDRHVQGLANQIMEATQKYGLSPFNIEGFEKGHWVLLDYGDVVVHIFYEGAREHYDLEAVWSHAGKLPVPAALEEESAHSAA